MLSASRAAPLIAVNFCAAGDQFIPESSCLAVVLIRFLGRVDTQCAGIEGTAGGIAAVAGIDDNPCTLQRRYRVIELELKFVAGVFSIGTVISTLAGETAINLLMVLVSMIFLAVYSWEIALVSVVCAPVFFWIIYRDNKRIIRQQTEVMGSYAVTESNFISTITGIATIKNFGRQDIFGKLNRMLYSIFQDRVFSLGKTQIRIGVLSGIASVLIMTGLVAYGAMSVFHGRMTTGELMAVLGITGSLFPAVASLALVAIPVNEAKVAFDRMFEIIGAGEDTDESREAPFLHDVGKLSIENLSFRFTGRKLLLEDVDMEFRKGEIVCIVGESGCGKSTLMPQRHPAATRAAKMNLFIV